METSAGVGDVVQARDVHGGVHFHQSLAPFAITPRQLPGPAQGFVNRDSELAQLARLAINETRIVIVTGTAGVGKTSLALKCAHHIRDQYPDGQLYTNLRGYDPGEPALPELVLAGFLRDLGVPARAIPSEIQDRAALYRSTLAGRRVLVVLDNAATVGQVRPLLPGDSGCLVIVTSRSRLSGLVAREGASRLQLELLNEDDSIALLRQTMSDHRSDDTQADLAELARLCARLPLALRIAAERAASRPHMALGELIADLRDESGLWDALTVGEEEDADAVRTVFAWSYRSLPESAARLFRLLGLHPASEFSSHAAAALAGITSAQARSDLDALVGAHLLEQTAPDRYQLHDLLRAYALDQVGQLESDQVRAHVTRRILAWYLHTADAARRVLAPYSRYVLDQSPPTGVTPLAFEGYEQALLWYRTEAANLVAAVRAAARAHEHSIAWRLAVVLRGIYMDQNAFDDWITTGLIGAESATSIGDRVGEAETLDSLGMAYFQLRRLDQSEACHRRALHIRRELGHRFGEAASINALGLLGLRHRRLDEAMEHFRAGEQIFAELGERRWVTLLQGNHAEALCEHGEYEAATSLAQAALPVTQELGDRFGEGDILFRLAWAHRGAGQLAAAHSSITAALVIAERNENDAWRGHWLAELARIQLAQGEPGAALDSSQRSAVIQRRLGDRSREAIALDLTGQAYQQLDRPDEAAKFHRRAASVHRELGDRWQLANTLGHLAAALDRVATHQEADQHRREAVTLLAEFPDPPATALRQRLTTLLQNP